MKKNFKQELLISEIKKAERYAEKRDGVKVIVSGYFTDWAVDDTEHVSVKCEICEEESGKRLEDVYLNIFVADRRRSWASDCYTFVRFEEDMEQAETEPAETEPEPETEATAEQETKKDAKTEWFTETFLPSFKDGETQISEKQYNVFKRYCKNSYERGYTLYHEGTFDGKRVRAYEWSCVTGMRYYVIIDKVVAA